jgi:predicted CxxxxCH...CXXCH cytochrome family protein
MGSGRRIAPLLAGALLAACGGARKVENAVAAGGGFCVDCHGGLDNSSGAPPNDTLGRTDTTLVSVGAHTAHVAAGLDCGACHVKPATVASPGHGDGQVTITWGPLSNANGTLHPTFDEGSATCANVYCHGAFRGGNRANAPRWTRVGAGEAACGTCHGVPPPQSTGHVQRSACGDCHAGYTATSVNAATHLNGTVEVGALSCTSCHGDSGRAATTTNPQLAAAPPLDAAGLQSSAQVGAHQAHLTDGALRPAMPCAECHAVPTTVAGGHPSGSTTFAWDPLLAATRGATPSYAGGACASTYCHGATLGAGGTNHAPRWSGGATEVECGTCHGVPPPAPHPQNVRCGRCHPGYDAGVNLAVHVNGVRDLLLSCTSCHGDAGRAPTAANPQLPAAPPTDTAGLQSSPRVGAHQAHLTDGALRPAMPCTECHAVPTTLGAAHPTGTTTFSWDPLLAATRGAAPSYAGGACASTYCHGATLGAGGSNHAPRWAGGAAEAACGTCHGVPPPAPHPQNARCGGCHPGYDAGVNLALHVNGVRDLAPMTCTSCHGDPGRAPTTLNPQLPAAPPTDAAGLASSARVGAHQAHLTDGALRPAMPCTECHAVPTTVTGGHPTGTTTLAWDPLLAATRGATPSYAGGACASTYCHGATLGAGGSNHAPRWAGGAADATCGTCHGVPPPAPHPQGTSCGRCHPGYDTGVNPAVHVNGVRDLLPMACTSCHGDPGRAPTALNPQLPAAPPTDAAGLASSAQVGAHLTHLSGSALAAAVACTECHAVPSAPVNLALHPTGATTVPLGGALATGALSAIVNPRPPGSGARVFSNLSTTTPGFAGGTCSSTYCHGAYSGSYSYPVPQSDPLEVTTITFTGSAAAPSWNGTVACGSCHGIPPATGREWHSGHHAGGNDCGLCHPDATGTSAANASVVDRAKHVDGKIDLTPVFQGSCFVCH